MILFYFLSFLDPNRSCWTVIVKWIWKDMRMYRYWQNYSTDLLLLVWAFIQQDRLKIYETKQTKGEMGGVSFTSLYSFFRHSTRCYCGCHGDQRAWPYLVFSLALSRLSVQVIRVLHWHKTRPQCEKVRSSLRSERNTELFPQKLWCIYCSKVWVDFKEVSFAQQGSIYLIKNIVKTVIL